MSEKQRLSPLHHLGYTDDEDDDDDEEWPLAYIKEGTSATRSSQTSRHDSTTRPLIDKVTNAWRSGKTNVHVHSSDDDSSSDDDRDCGEYCDCETTDPICYVASAAVRNRRIRRSMYLLLLAIIAYIGYRVFLKEGWDEEKAMLQSFNSPKGTYGLQDWNKFSDIVQMKELQAEHLPGGEYDMEGKRRLVFVGDIHGCNDELKKLMDKIGFNKDKDHLICTGDVISKGPDSLGVIDTLISLNASSVRGNHEDKALVAAKRGLKHTALDSATRKELAANLKAEDLSPYFERHHMDWLRSLPLIIHIPAITRLSTTSTSPRAAAAAAPAQEASDLEDPDLLILSKTKKGAKKLLHMRPIHDEIHVVHGGLVPGLPLRRQDPYSVMNMRSLSRSSHVPSRDREKGVAWEKMWNWYNDRLAKHRGRGAGGVKKWSWFQEDYELIPPPAALLPPSQDTNPDENARDSWTWPTPPSWLEKFLKGTSETDPDDLLRLKLQSPSVVVYGHDSPRGLNLHRWTKGLDSGCVRGGYLTALVVDAWGRARLVQVRCGKHV